MKPNDFIKLRDSLNKDLNKLYAHRNALELEIESPKDPDTIFSNKIEVAHVQDICEKLEEAVNNLEFFIYS